MRVLLVSGTYPPQSCGVGDYTARLAAELHERGLHVAVLTSAGHDRRADSLWPVLPYVRRWNLAGLAQVRRAAARWSADIVHLQFPSAAYAGTASAAVALLPAYLRLAVPRVRTVVTLHDFAIGHPLARLRSGPLILAAHAVTVSNQRDLLAIHRSFPAHWTRHVRQVRVGPNILPVTVSRDELHDRRRRLGLEDGAPLIGYFGLISRSKRLELLLDALPTLVAATPQLRCLMLGAVVDDDYAAELRGRCDRLGIVRRVIWTGRQPAEETSRLLRLCDFAVLPFERGADFRRSSLLACLGHGVPVLTNSDDRYGTDADLADCGAVELVHDLDPNHWQAAIRGLLEDLSLRTRMRQAALQLSQQFSWGAIAGQMEQLYRELMCGPADFKARPTTRSPEFHPATIVPHGEPISSREPIAATCGSPVTTTCG